jgi:hypothetical protein
VGVAQAVARRHRKSRRKLRGGGPPPHVDRTPKGLGVMGPDTSRQRPSLRSPRPWFTGIFERVSFLFGRPIADHEARSKHTTLVLSRLSLRRMRTRHSGRLTPPRCIASERGPLMPLGPLDTPRTLGPPPTCLRIHRPEGPKGERQTCGGNLTGAEASPVALTVGARTHEALHASTPP